MRYQKYNKEINNEIFRLAIPSVLASITIPLVGMVDTAVAGHIDGNAVVVLDNIGAVSPDAASYIGAISVGAIFFSLLYWGFSFLRTGTGGLIAQAYGRGDMLECGSNLLRGCLLAFLVSILMLVLRLPFMNLVSSFIDASPTVLELAKRYFLIRIWAAPATLSLMSFRGFFVGMQDAMSSMWTDLVINIINVGASIVLTFGIGSWSGMGFDGIAAGTVVAQYVGLIYCLIVCRVKYRNVIKQSSLKDISNLKYIGGFFKMNVNLFIRSVCFITIYVGYTSIAAKFGDLYLSCSSIVMQLLLLFSYFTDGFAYAGEALTGRFIGAKDQYNLRQTILYVFGWSMLVTFVFIGIYAAFGDNFILIFTSEQNVIDACHQYLPWLILMPVFGCASFTWDGIFIGATESVSLRNVLFFSAVSFFVVWFAGKAITGLHFDSAVAYDASVSAKGLHLLLLAYFSSLAVRSIYLTWKYFRCRKNWC